MAHDFEFYKSALSIDIDALHIECQDQAVHYQAVSEEAAELKYQVKNQRLKINQLEAQLWLDAKNNPIAFELPTKPTMDDLKSFVAADGELEELRKQLNSLEHLLQKWEGLLTGYDQRRSMLNTEARLYEANYWGDAKQTSDVRAAHYGRKASVAGIEAELEQAAAKQDYRPGARKRKERGSLDNGTEEKT